MFDKVRFATMVMQGRSDFDFEVRLGLTSQEVAKYKKEFNLTDRRSCQAFIDATQEGRLIPQPTPAGTGPILGTTAEPPKTKPPKSTATAVKKRFEKEQAKAAKAALEKWDIPEDFDSEGLFRTLSNRGWKFTCDMYNLTKGNIRYAAQHFNSKVEWDLVRR